MQPRNKSRKYQRKMNRLDLEIEKQSEKILFESNFILSCFHKDKISSSDFTLNRFNTKRKFVNKFCQKRWNIKIAGGKLIKLWDALNHKYNISRNSPFYSIQTDFQIYDEKSLVFISNKSTESIIKNGLLKEPFTTPRRLYQYLNWTIRINKINQFIQCFKTAANNIAIMIINSELHDKNDEILYIFCIKNDVTTTKAQKWQFVQLLTAQQITELTTSKKTELLIYGYIRRYFTSASSVSNFNGSVPTINSLINQYMPAINSCDSMQNLSMINLPIGVRYNAVQFTNWRDDKLIRKQQILMNNNIKKSRYQQLKSIQTGYDKKKTEHKLQISLNEFYNAINSALNSNDIRHNMIPIVSILSGKRYNQNGNYSIDQILPVEISNNWIGVIYRKGLPISTLIDKYDIINKAILCDPKFDQTTLEYFVNNVTKIEIGSNIGNNNMSNEMYEMQLKPPVYEGNNTTNNNMFAYNNYNVSMDGYANTNTNTNTTATVMEDSINNNITGSYNYKIANNSNGTNINATTFSPASKQLKSIDEGHAMTETKQEILVTAASTPMTPIMTSVPMVNTCQPMVYNNTNNTNNIINYNLNVMNTSMGIAQPLITNMGIAVPVTALSTINIPVIYIPSQFVVNPSNPQLMVLNGIGLCQVITVPMQSVLGQVSFSTNYC